MDRKFTFEKGEYYHIYNRGVDKRKIFFSNGDWKHFQRLLFFRNDKDAQVRVARSKTLLLAEIERKEKLIDICVYTMMPNHFHLLILEKKVGGISKFMSKLLTSFSMYMNKKYDRSGPLMCRPFRAVHIDSDQYLRWLVSYIHLNPIDQVEPEWRKKGISDKKTALSFLQAYPYSSYYDYFVSDRDESHIISKDVLPMSLDGFEDFSATLNTLKEAADKSEWSRTPLDHSGSIKHKS